MIFFAAISSMKTNIHARSASTGGNTAENFFCASASFSTSLI
jgi:hypothetical protein